MSRLRVVTIVAVVLAAVAPAVSAPGQAAVVQLACPQALRPPKPAARDALLSTVVAPDTNGIVPTSRESRMVRRALLNATRYIVTTEWPTVPAMHSSTIGRGVGGEGLALATSVVIGGYDPAVVGKPLSYARKLAHVLTMTTVCRHRSVAPTPPPYGWGADGRGRVPANLHAYKWPQAAANVGLAGWLMWPHLTPDARYYVANMMVREADTLLDVAPNYTFDRSGRELFVGDSKAEEDAWVSMALTLAVAMMPNHSHAARWRHKEVEFQIASYSSKANMTSDTVVNGGRLRDWLHGWNIRNNGTLINHRIEHPLYMAAIHLKLNAIGVYGLTHTATPRAAIMNGKLVYRALISHRYPSPPFLAPGGTSYRRGSRLIYHPDGNDWGKRVYGIYVSLDAAARALQLSPYATEFLGLHTSAQLALQNRHADGHSYNHLWEFNYKFAEQWVATVMARAWLDEWAFGNNRISIDNGNYFN